MEVCATFAKASVNTEANRERRYAGSVCNQECTECHEMTTTRSNTKCSPNPRKSAGKHAQAAPKQLERAYAELQASSCYRKRGRGGLTQVEVKSWPSPELNPRSLDFFCFSFLDPETASAYLMKAKAQGKQDEK
jgi:hypothetical protein